jgi:hypothetical protein
MATPTSTVLINSQTHRQVYVTFTAAGSDNQADAIIYDPTTTPFTNSGVYVGTKIRRITVQSSVTLNTTACNAAIVFDASTPVLAYSIPLNSHACFDFEKNAMVPLLNYAGAGVTGKLGLTTTGLAAGDNITIVIDIING